MKLRVHSDMRDGRRKLRLAQYFLFGAALLALGFCLVVYLRSRIYQQREAERLTYLPPKVKAPAPGAPGTKRTGPPALRLSVTEGSAFSLLEIPRLGVSVAVIEGVRQRNLLLGAGHIPGTAFPDERGNVGIAAHRDTFFRPLRKLKANDIIQLTTSSGTYRYAVDWMQIVKPTDVQVLRPSERPVLTLVTCYPFYYVGSAPKRFIVRAQQLDGPSKLPEPDRMLETSSRFDSR